MIAGRSVEEAFREAMVEVKPGYYHGPLWKGQRAGMAKGLLSAIGENAPTVVRTCVLDWKGFQAEVAKSSTFKVADEPSIGALLQHVGAAMQFVVDRESSGGDAADEFTTMKDLIG